MSSMAASRCPHGDRPLFPRPRAKSTPTESTPPGMRTAPGALSTLISLEIGCRLGAFHRRHSRIGAWRSLVAHLLWEQDVGGSNPLAPTRIFKGQKRVRRKTQLALFLSRSLLFFLCVPYVFPTRLESRVLNGIELRQLFLPLQVPGDDQVRVSVRHGQVGVSDHVLHVLEIGA